MSLVGQVGALATRIATEIKTVKGQVSGKEPTIVAGTAAQYWRGDKTWRSLAADAALPPIIGGPTPVGPAAGQLWYDDVNDILMIFDGVGWQEAVAARHYAPVDSGWVNLTIASGFKAGTLPQVRSIDDQVRFRGSIQPNSGSFATSSNITIGTVPSGLRVPQGSAWQIAGSNGGASQRCTLGTDGSIVLNTGASATTLAILDSISYWLD